MILPEFIIKLSSLADNVDECFDKTFREYEQSVNLSKDTCNFIMENILNWIDLSRIHFEDKSDEDEARYMTMLGFGDITLYIVIVWTERAFRVEYTDSNSF